MSIESNNCRLRFTDLLSARFTEPPVLPKAEKSNEVLNIAIPALSTRTTLWRITLDQKGDAFTPRVVTYTREGVVEAVYNLLDYTNLGGYEFPTAIAWSATRYPPTIPPTLLDTGIITVVSARIPDQIAESTFLLDESPAAVVWDRDKRKALKLSPPLASVVAKRGMAKRTLLVLILLSALVIPIAFAKSRRSNRL
jgi:hypothetical protein